MGQIRNAHIEAFQRRAGLNLPTPAQRQLWRKLQETCFEAIKIAELEISGIRDGDGCWGGGDVLGGIWGKLERVVAELSAGYEAQFRAQFDKTMQRPNPDHFCADDTPWL